MEVKAWTYEEFPEFTEIPEGAGVLETSGDEPGVAYIPDVKYQTEGGMTLRLQVLIPYCRNDPFDPLLPEQRRALPCVVYVQGSAWMAQDCYRGVPLLSKLAARGFVSAIVEYRHSGIAPFPAQAVDARNAVRFLRKNAAVYGIDPERIVLAGSSSGGHTALWAAMRQNDGTAEDLYPGVSAAVKGIVDYYGAVSAMPDDGYPTTLNHHLPDSPEGLEMGRADLRAHPELRKTLSVECNVGPETPLPPVLILHGTKDRTVSTKISVLLYEALRAAGKDARMYLLRGADHGGAEFWTEPVLDLVEGFLRECLA